MKSSLPLIPVLALIGNSFGNSFGKPNILIIVADDCAFSDLPVNEGQNDRTPHLDALARESLVFDRAYLGMAMCSPCRSERSVRSFPQNPKNGFAL